MFSGEDERSRFGQLSFVDWDPTRPNEKFFEHLDWVVRRAGEIGLVVGMLPTWGEFVGPLLHGRGPVCFNEDNAYSYGEFLGRRYRDAPNVIWVLGGDRNPDEEWVDFNMLQTGTRIDRPNYKYIRRDYERTGHQAKPVLDGECRYEFSHEFFYTIPASGRRIDAHQVRKAMYNAMLSGAAGHTYGCRCVWNFYHEGGPKTRDTALDWRKALDLGVGRSGLRRADALPDRGARRRRLRLGG